MLNKKTLRIGGVPEHFNLPWHNAINAHAFKEVDVEFVEFPGGTGAMTRALKDEQLDMALLLFEGAVTNILRGNSNRIVKVYVDSPLIWGIHVAADSPIATVDEIRDKVFAISRAGSGSHLIAIVDAAERGWPTDRIKFSKVGNLTGAREKLANGKVDVFLWEKFTTQPLVDSGEFRRVGERIVPWPAFVVSVRNSVLDEHATKIKSLLNVVDRFCADFKNANDSVDVVSDTFNIKRSDSAQWFEHVQWSQGFDCPEETIHKIVRYLSQSKIVNQQKIEVDQVWWQL